MRILYPSDFVPSRSLLTFIRRTNIDSPSSLAKGFYSCKCGGFIEAYINNVKRGKCLSCGCHRKATKGALKHGFSDHPLYGVWENMYSRCYNTKVKSYPDYGGRGIEMCDEWKCCPSEFIKWGISNGWQLGLEVDKDIKGGMMYSPENCIFITPKLNSNHRRSSRVITYNGITQTMAQWADQIGISHSGLHYRLKLWPLSHALNKYENVSKLKK